MDPLSITAATIGIADVAFRVGRFLTRTIEGSRNVDSDLRHLLAQVDSLVSINNGIKNITTAPDFEQTFRRSFRGISSLANPQEWEQLWRDTERISIEITRLLENLERLLKAIQGFGVDAVGDNSSDHFHDKGLQKRSESQVGAFRAFRHSASSKISTLRTQVRKDSKAKELKDIRLQLSSNQNALQTCLAAITLGWNIYSHQMTSELLSQSRDDFTDFMTKLQDQLASLQPQEIPESQSRNKIFQAPAASDLFTGRMALLNQVEEAFGLITYPFVDAAGELTDSPTSLVPSLPQSTVREELHQVKVRTDHTPTHYHALNYGRKQKRFILVGLGGSGKTEFCRKFAQQNQPSFWGVFWIDATSDETVQHSYKEVAQVGGVDGNIKAAMTWLAGLSHPWLLVIDNADDPHMEVERYFPGGERGHILVTTRRPALRHLGNVGEGYYEFEKLDEMEAHDLLLKHAREKTPWDETAQSLAKRITEVLGYLPLALVCAGKAIAEGITTLAEYISWFNDSWDRIRLQSKRSGRFVDETSKNVFAPYEAMLQALGQEDSQSAEDAIELLKMLSFLHHEGISMDVMIKAAHNPPAIETQLRTEYDEKQQKELEDIGMKTTPKPKPWRRRLKDRIINAVGWYEERVIFPVLPQVLRNDKTSSFSVHRLRAALTRLNQKSLVTLRRRNGTDMYSMHPLIHRWVRERPEMSIGERGLWCHAAITMLNQCIPLPPLGGGDSEVAFRRQLLPHLDAVRKFQSQSKHMLEENGRSRIFSSLLLLKQPSIDRAKAQQYARFSRLYSECGRFQDAADLQEQVKDYAINMLGLDDERTTLIMLALSGTYFALSRINDAAALQSQALETCNKALGPDHPRTLKVMDALGKTECFRGRFKEARKLHEDALEGMQANLPATHHDIFLCMDNLGVVWHRYFQYERAEKLHAQAFAGLSKALGKDHPDTLIAKENLAMTYLEMSLNFGQETSNEVILEEGADSLLKAYTLELEVLTTRQNMGKENNWTLWAISNLARIKSSLGHFEEAEADMQAALEVGIRNLGESHFGILSGKTHLARVLAAQKKYAEAETMFQDVIIKGSYQKGLRSEGESPDHLMAVWYYAGFCQSIGKTSKAISLLEGVSGGLTAIGATQHPFWKRLWDKLEALRTEIDTPAKLKDTGDAKILTDPESVPQEQTGVALGQTPVTTPPSPEYGFIYPIHNQNQNLTVGPNDIIDVSWTRFGINSSTIVQAQCWPRNNTAGDPTAILQTAAPAYVANLTRANPLPANQTSFTVHVASLNPYSPCIIVLINPQNIVSNDGTVGSRPFLISESNGDAPVNASGRTWSASNPAPLTLLNVKNGALPVSMSLSIVYAMAIGVGVAVIPGLSSRWL